MSECCVVVADAHRARLFILEAAARPKFESGPRLVEQGLLENPEAEGRDAEIFSETRTGANRSTGGPTHRYDDHRENHHLEFERRFARTVATEARKLKETHGARRVVFAAGARTLGLLRHETDALRIPDAEVCGLARDMTHLPAAEIQTRLAADGLVPACVRPPRQHRPVKGER